MVKGTPADEISAVVARRRKDFTKEFFVHLHTVAESYHDKPTEQNGDVPPPCVVLLDSIRITVTTKQVRSSPTNG